MAGSRRRRQLQRQRERQQAAVDQFQLLNLPPDLLPLIQHRLAFLTRLAFASVCGGGAAAHHLKPETPWLILPKENEDRARVLSLSDGKSANVRTSEVAIFAIGSSGGWLVTADVRGALRMTNPATGAHADLPAITTVPFINPISGGQCFCTEIGPLLQARFGDQPPPPTTTGLSVGGRSYRITTAQMRQMFYRKVVLSESPRPNSYAAMLITEPSCIGAPAFATTEDDPVPSWRMARSLDAVEDAIHHDGRFLSITYTGRVEAWQRDADIGEFTSAEVAPRLAAYEDKQHLRRKYLAASSTDGRLMAVLKHSMPVDSGDRYYYRNKQPRVVFKVLILDRVKGRWEEAADIGDTALFVGVNGSLCLSTREHQGICPGCVYFTNDEVGAACLNKADGGAQADDTELRDVGGVYNLKTDRLETIPGLGDNQQPQWPPPAWFTPSFL